MTLQTVNQTLQFINSSNGLTCLINSARYGTIAHVEAKNHFNAVGTAIDMYESKTGDGSLTETRSLMSRYPRDRRRMFHLVEKYDPLVHLAVVMALKGDAAIAGAAAVNNLAAPCDLGAEWRWIPPGRFMMGSRRDDPYARDNEAPLRSITTGGFYMLSHTATTAEYDRFLAAVGQKDTRRYKDGLCGDHQPEVRGRPTAYQEYSVWLGKELSRQLGVTLIGRLPTEEEWERAAKGPHGNEFIIPATDQQAHFHAQSSRPVNHPDARLNGWGLSDMIGNVWEVTLGNPEEFIIRGGGSWRDCYPRLYNRAAYRWSLSEPEDRYFNIGFRPVLVHGEDVNMQNLAPSPQYTDPRTVYEGPRLHHQPHLGGNFDDL